MGFWFPDTHLAANESVRYRGAGNLFNGRRQIGAQVTVTDRRVLIVPNRLNGVLGGNRVELARDEVVTVHAEPSDSPTARQRGPSAGDRAATDRAMVEFGLACRGCPNRWSYWICCC